MQNMLFSDIECITERVEKNKLRALNFPEFISFVDKSDTNYSLYLLGLKIGLSIYCSILILVCFLFWKKAAKKL